MDDYMPPPLLVGPPIDRSIRGAVLCGGFRPDEVIFNSLRVPYDCAAYAELDNNLHRLADALNGTAPTRRYYNVNDVTEPLLDIDILTAGFPCQPFAGQGLSLGPWDSHGRGLVVFQILDIIRKARPRPRCVMLENVDRLFTAFPVLTSAIIADLERLGYEVMVERHNGKNSIIPQNRPRIWIIAILSSYYVHPWNGLRDLTVNASLENGFIDLDRVVPVTMLTDRQTRVVSKLAARTKSWLQDYPDSKIIMMNIGGTEDNAHAMLDQCPCLTATRAAAKGHLIRMLAHNHTVDDDIVRVDARHNTLLELDEIGHLMGYETSHTRRMQRLTGLSTHIIGHAFGNAWQLNVAERLLGRLLFSSGLVYTRIQDAWEVADTSMVRMGRRRRPRDTLAYVRKIRNKLQATWVRDELAERQRHGYP